MIKFIKRKVHNLISDKKFSEILTGSAWAIFARVLGTGFGLVSSIVIARLYGAEVMGIVAVLNSFLSLVTIFTVLGTKTSLLRLIPEHLLRYSPTSAFKLYRKTSYIVIGISLITGVLFVSGSRLIAVRVFSKPHLSFYFTIAALFVVFNSLMLLNTQAVRGLKLIRAFAFMQVLPSLSNMILLVSLTIIFFKWDNPIYAYLASLAVTGSIGWLIMEHAFKSRMQSGDRIVEMSVRTILSISLPMLMTAGMQFVIGQTGVIMLGIFQSEAEVGYYAAAVKLATLTAFALKAINSMAAPQFSELFHSGKMDDLFHVAKKSTKLIFWITSPILLILVVLGQSVIRLLYGQEFTVAYHALLLLVVGQFVNSISGSTAIFMNMTGNQVFLRNIVFISAMLNILLNFWLIPAYGIYGAAFAGTVSLSLWNIITLVYIKINYGRTIGYIPILC